MARQAKAVVDAVDCALKVGGTLAVRDWAELPGQLAEAARGCLVDVVVKAVGEADTLVRLLGGLAGEGKQIPALGQLAAIGILNVFTRSNVARVSFTVRQVVPALQPFVDTRWENSCGDIEMTMAVRPDYTGQWQTRFPNFDAGNTYTTRTTRFHLVLDAGRPTAVFDSTDDPDGPAKGSKARFSLDADGTSVAIAADGAGGAGGAGLVFYRNRSDYC